jgi:hypothetical protein
MNDDNRNFLIFILFFALGLAVGLSVSYSLIERQKKTIEAKR